MARYERTSSGLPLSQASASGVVTSPSISSRLMNMGPGIVVRWRRAAVVWLVVLAVAKFRNWTDRTRYNPCQPNQSTPTPPMASSSTSKNVLPTTTGGAGAGSGVVEVS